MDELRCNFVSVTNDVDINVPVSIVIKAFVKAEITGDDGSANSFDFDWLLMSVRMHAPLRCFFLFL